MAKAKVSELVDGSEVVSEVVSEAVSESPALPPPKPVSPSKKFRVTLGDKSGVYAARDKDEAWAYFCEHHKTYPSPKRADRAIEELA